jgi:hypothetical protein
MKTSNTMNKVMREKKSVLIDCLLAPLGAFTLGLYTQLDSYLFTTLQTDFYHFTTRLLDYKGSILRTLFT